MVRSANLTADEALLFIESLNKNHETLAIILNSQYCGHYECSL
ncbi:MAG: hypothetical protein QG673_67 [Pseudomonadota bacterium]|nr:hypothetical protein [Pseudomonadota bacterium]